MIGSAVLLILIVSLSIYAIRENLGEALLSLIGGILAIFARTWTADLYIAFSIAWIGFTLLALLISSLKLAAKNDDIYRQAAIWLNDSGDEFKSTMKKLKDIGLKKTDLSVIGPVERAEVIRTLVFHGISINMLTSGIIATEVLSVITKCDIDKVSIFVADFFLSFHINDENEAKQLTDKLYEKIRNTPVPPEEFFIAFEKSRRLIKSKSLEPDVFLSDLQQCLSMGVPVDNIFDKIQSDHNNK
ncbi:MAG: hypothetical protein Q3M30_12425 [Candidatus Electrothrix sp. Rat3]|nr:hypothetical protein [Candidatus Electrothrix rattekaaiensis]